MKKRVLIATLIAAALAVAAGVSAFAEVWPNPLGAGS
jgi:hypothetical protein